MLKKVWNKIALSLHGWHTTAGLPERFWVHPFTLLGSSFCFFGFILLLCWVHPFAFFGPSFYFFGPSIRLAY